MFHFFCNVEIISSDVTSISKVDLIPIKNDRNGQSPSPSTWNILKIGFNKLFSIFLRYDNIQMSLVQVIHLFLKVKDIIHSYFWQTFKFSKVGQTILKFLFA